jgi:sugar lactone lactonase YvrE
MTRVIVGSLLLVAVAAFGQGRRGAPAGAANAEQAPRGGGRQLSKLIEGPDLGVKPVPNPLPLPAGMMFGALGGVVLDSKEHLFVFGGTRPELTQYKADPLPLVEFDQNGKFVRAFGESLGYSSPHGFRIDDSDNFWVTDIGNHTVMKLNPKGDILITLGTKGKAGVWDEAAGNHTLNQPTDIALAKNGDVFVGQGHGGGGSGDPRILRFDKNGKYITSWSGKVDGPEAFSNVHAVIMDPDNHIWVGDRTAKKVLVFDVNGKLVKTIQMPVYVCSFYVAKNGQLYMLSGWDGQILKMDWEGKILAATGKPGRGLNQYGEAESMVINSKGEIFVADKVNDYVQKLIPK